MAEPMDTDAPQPIDLALESVLFPNQSTSTPPPNQTVSRLSHPPPPIDSPVLSAAHTPSKPSPPVMAVGAKEGTPVNGGPKPVTSGGAGHDEKGSGAPARQYLNEYITPYLLEGMKMIVREQPSNPLETLGRYLIQRSQTIDGANTAAMATSNSLNAAPNTGTATSTSTPGPSGAAATPSKGTEVKMEEAP